MINKELVDLKRQLDSASDNLNKRILQYQSELKTLSLGADAWVDITPNIKIGYAKHKGEWKILINYNELGDLLSNTPIMESPRELRLLGYKNFPKLLKAIEEKAIDLLSKMNEALQ